MSGQIRTACSAPSVTLSAPVRAASAASSASASSARAPPDPLRALRFLDKQAPRVQALARETPAVEACANPGQMMTFADLGLSDELLRAVTEAGYDEPTPIQRQAIPS